MGRKNVKQMNLDEFLIEFYNKLDPSNELVILADILDWDLAERLYEGAVSDSIKNTNSKDSRIAFGALILQQMYNYTDEGLISFVKMNPYFQYFLGMKEFTYSCPFVQSTLVQFRKRITPKMIKQLNESVCRGNDTDDENHGNHQNKIDKQDKENETEDEKLKGKLILDATCAPQDIKFPTDLDLLNKAREKTEKIIDHLHEPMIGKVKKVRTYRIEARKSFLKVSKSKKRSKQSIRKAIRFQLNCLERNLRYINEMTHQEEYNHLTDNQTWDIIVINELYRQQKYMFDNDVHKINDRIVSLHSPHIRPVVRGKEHAAVEFGAKLAISVVDGFVYIEKLSWDSYNEGQTLIESVENYKKRFGYYPKEILADKIYRNRENLKYLKSLGIKINGPKLGKPKKDEVIDKQAERIAEGERNIVEGKFGEGKRCLSLDKIMAKTKDTSETVISLIILVINIKKRLRLSYTRFLRSNKIVFFNLLHKDLKIV